MLKNLNVIFDMDGVIFDSERFFLECCIPAAEKAGLEGMRDVAYQCIGLTEKETEKLLWNKYRDMERLEVFRQELVSAFQARYQESGLPLKPGVVELLTFLMDAGAKTAIGSSTRSDTIKEELHDADLLGYFDVIVGGEMVEASKPEPDLFLRAAKELGCDSKDCYIIEDSHHGVRAARKAGAKVIMVPDLLPPTEEIQALTDWVFHSLLDVREFFLHELQSVETDVDLERNKYV